MDIKYVTVKALLDEKEQGQVQAVFSVFNEIDLDGDVVLASAFVDGQDVPMVWSHNWDMPIGKGIIRVQPDRAVFDGMFNLNTSWGRDAYESVKFQGELQEYSWGFLPTVTRRETRDDRSVRIIEASRVFEVSPVLVGANEHTGTLLVKGQYPSFEAQIEAVLAAVLDVKERAGSLAELRAKEGRMISTARRERLAKFPPALREMADDIFGMLEETAPPEKGIDTAEVERFLLWSLRRNGVAV